MLCSALVLLLAGSAMPKEPDEELEFQKQLDERYSPEFRERVNAAINRGMKHLLAQQKPDGSWSGPHDKAYPMGHTVLTVLTLHKAGIPRTHPRMQKAWEYLCKLPLRKTYSVSLLLMALDAKYAPARDPFEVVETDRYGFDKRKKGDDPCAVAISKKDRELMRRGVKFLVEAQTGEGVWRYPTKQQFDLSNTQYALLGLKSALRCRIKVPQSVWLRALEYLLAWQDQDGKAVELEGNELRGRYRLTWKEKAKARGFRYAKRDHPVTGSMTTAGLAGLVICKGALWKSRRFKGKLRGQTRRGIRDSMAWLQEHFDVTTNPSDPPPKEQSPFLSLHANHYYYLYGLERAGILTRARYFGEFDWYEDGAEFLMHQQNDDGSWNGPPEDTCFAILFLKRATSRMRIPAVTPSAPDK